MEDRTIVFTKIKHTSIYCQESKEFFSKTLGWFNEYHKENVQPSNKQILFNTFEDSFPLQTPNSIVYFIFCVKAVISFVIYLFIFYYVLYISVVILSSIK